MTRELGLEGTKELGKGGWQQGNKSECPGVEESGHQISKEICGTTVSREDMGGRWGRKKALHGTGGVW